MQKITLICPNEGRKLKKILLILFKKGCINDVRVQNNVKHYRFDEKKLRKEEKKQLSLLIPD